MEDPTNLRQRDVGLGKYPPKVPVRRDATLEVDPDCVGTLDYPIVDYEDDCCCCCCPPAPPKFCYKRRMGGAFICCETIDKKTGEQKITCMMGAAWQFSILTYGLVFGISGFVYLLCLPKMHMYFSLAAFCVFSLGLLALTCTGCTDPGIVPRYKKPKVVLYMHLRDCAKSNYFAFSLHDSHRGRDSHHAPLTRLSRSSPPSPTVVH